MKDTLALATAYQAVRLSDELAQRLPEGVDAAGWELFAAIWPLAVRVAELELTAEKRRPKDRKKTVRAERARLEALAALDVRR